MCARYTDLTDVRQIALAFKADIDFFREWKPTYNISPSHGPGFEQPIVSASPGGRRAHLARWWLIPTWWKKSLKELPSAFNARAEDVAGKPMFRDAFRSRRVLVPATGWREWTGPKGAKQPHHFHLPGHEPFAFAGLASRWVSPDGERIDSFTIVTTEPSERAAKYHDRMPLVLSPDLYDEWLDSKNDGRDTLARAQQLALDFPLQVYDSNPVANSSRFEGPEAIQKA